MAGLIKSLNITDAILSGFTVSCFQCRNSTDSPPGITSSISTHVYPVPVDSAHRVFNEAISSGVVISPAEKVIIHLQIRYRLKDYTLLHEAKLIYIENLGAKHLLCWPCAHVLYCYCTYFHRYFPTTLLEHSSFNLLMVAL